jgi:UPF0176 protein
MYILAALYQFAAVSDPEGLKNLLETECRTRDITGALILATEGINGTIAGFEPQLREVMVIIQTYFDNLELKYSSSDEQPFVRLRIRVKPEIVTMDFPLVSKEFDLTRSRGEYVDCKDWNNLIRRPDVFVLDTRNEYEIGIGSFERAVNPMTSNFKEFPDYVSQNFGGKKNIKVAMFCTGGVRCEKASAYMKYMGIETIYHLKGGILKYLEEIPPDESLFKGSCYVFDRRVAVSHGLLSGDIVACHCCRHPLSSRDLASDCYEKGVTCPYCFDSISVKKRESALERQQQIELAAQRQVKHLGMKHVRAVQLQQKREMEHSQL